MATRGWQPEFTATHQRANESLRRFIDRPQTACLWCWGQGMLYMRSDDFRAFMPVTCPMCGPKKHKD